jgi:hypothetical protein
MDLVQSHILGSSQFFGFSAFEVPYKDLFGTLIETTDRRMFWHYSTKIQLKPSKCVNVNGYFFISVNLNFSGVLYRETSHENDCDEDNSCS